MRPRLFVAAAALPFLSVAGLIAQNRGTITGTVVDDQGTPLPGVAVELTRPTPGKRCRMPAAASRSGFSRQGHIRFASGSPASTTSCRRPPFRRARQRG